MKDVSPLTLMCVAAALYIGFGGFQMEGCPIPDILNPLPSQVTAVTYVYEKDDGGVPSPVGSAINTLNRRTPPILATIIEDDIVDSSGSIPLQYQTAIKTARDNGLPSLVIQAGDKVLKVLKEPKTEKEILEAVP